MGIATRKLILGTGGRDLDFMARTGGGIWSWGLALRARIWLLDYQAVSGTVCWNLELGLEFGNKFV